MLWVFQPRHLVDHFIFSTHNDYIFTIIIIKQKWRQQCGNKTVLGLIWHFVNIQTEIDLNIYIFALIIFSWCCHTVFFVLFFWKYSKFKDPLDKAVGFPSVHFLWKQKKKTCMYVGITSCCSLEVAFLWNPIQWKCVNEEWEPYHTPIVVTVRLCVDCCAHPSHHVYYALTVSIIPRLEFSSLNETCIQYIL